MMTVRKVNPSTKAIILALRSSAEDEPTCLLGKAIAAAGFGFAQDIYLCQLTKHHQWQKQRRDDNDCAWLTVK